MIKKYFAAVLIAVTLITINTQYIYAEEINDTVEIIQNEEERYPAAKFIWDYFKNLGYSDHACAGILGNVMAEVGGQTLNIRHEISSKYYSGICQWDKRHSTLAGDATLEEQCEYLENTIGRCFEVFGKDYQENFEKKDFMTIEDETEAAIAFAKCYERCSSISYEVRKTNATKAYNYFTQ